MGVGDNAILPLIANPGYQYSVLHTNTKPIYLCQDMSRLVTSCHVMSFIMETNNLPRTRSFPPTQFQVASQALSNDLRPWPSTHSNPSIPDSEMTAIFDDMSWVCCSISISSILHQNNNAGLSQQAAPHPKLLYIPCALQTPPIFAPVDSIRLWPQSAQLKSSSMFTSMSSG